MLRPPELESERPYGPWSSRGRDSEALRRLLQRDSNLYRAEYWYTPPLHFAVREGHLEAVRVLLDAGADPTAVGLSGDRLVTIARDRGHEAVARLLEETAARRPHPPPVNAGSPDPPIHAAAAADDVEEVRRLLDADPNGVVESSGSATYAAHTPELRALLMSRGGRLDAYDLVWLDEDDEALRRRRSTTCAGVTAGADRGRIAKSAR